MRTTSRIRLLIILMGLVLFTGCVIRMGYGRITAAPKEKTIEGLLENWKDFDVYYSGLNPDRPSGLMFDPKHDDRELIGKRWEPVHDREAIERIVMWLGVNDVFQPRLLRILGPEQVLYGYVYTGWNQVVARSVDVRTMYVMGLPAPLPEEKMVTR